MTLTAHFGLPEQLPPAAGTHSGSVILEPTTAAAMVALDHDQGQVLITRVTGAGVDEHLPLRRGMRVTVHCDERGNVTAWNRLLSR